MVENIVQIELSYINTKHPDFHKDAVLAGSLMAQNEMTAVKRLESTQNMGGGGTRAGSK